jgi:hypothetical protein
MTIQEFNSTRFGAGDLVIYKNQTWPIIEVDFEEALFGIPNERGITVEVADQMTWVRCENCQHIPKEITISPNVLATYDLK